MAYSHLGPAHMDMSAGNVARIFGTLQQVRPGASVGRGHSQSHSLPPGVRHGSVERSVGPRRQRERSREHQNRTGSGQPIGPQNAMDLDERFEAIEDRLETCERYSRMHAQTISITDEIVTSNRHAIKTISDDIGAYKSYLASTHVVIQKYIDDKHEGLSTSTMAIASMLQSHVESLDSKFAVLESVLSAFQGHPAG